MRLRLTRLFTAQRVLRYIEAGKKEGARLACGGTQLERDGYFVAPTVFTDVAPNMLIAKEEIFGPVLTIYVFDDADWEKTLEHIDTTSQYGLTGSMYVLPP